MYKKTRTRILAVIFAFFGALPVHAEPRVHHVFIFSIDGGKPAVIEKSDMPVLKKLAAEGAYSWKATTIFPSKTLPAHTSMLTGVGPDKHNVLWNDFLPEKGIVHVPTVFSIAHEAGFSTAIFAGKEKFRHLVVTNTVDEFSFNQPESHKLEKTVMNDNGKPETFVEYTVLAKTVATDAAAYIPIKKPNLSFIHFTDTDDTGHTYGWGSPEQKKAFADVDAALGVVLDSIRKAGIIDDSVIIVTADHGGHKFIHGTKMPDDMTIPWVIWGKGVKKDFKIKTQVNICDTAATALWLLGLSCPDCDGKPVTSAFVQ